MSFKCRDHVLSLVFCFVLNHLLLNVTSYFVLSSLYLYVFFIYCRILFCILFWVYYFCLFYLSSLLFYWVHLQTQIQVGLRPKPKNLFASPNHSPTLARSWSIFVGPGLPSTTWPMAIRPYPKPHTLQPIRRSRPSWLPFFSRRPTRNLLQLHSSTSPTCMANFACHFPTCWPLSEQHKHQTLTLLSIWRQSQQRAPAILLSPSPRDTSAGKRRSKMMMTRKKS